MTDLLVQYRTQRLATLGFLRGGPRTTTDFCRFMYLNSHGTPVGLAPTYRGSISDLRKDGYIITYHQAKGGRGTYTLDYEPPRQAEGTRQMVLAL